MRDTTTAKMVAARKLPDLAPDQWRNVEILRDKPSSYYPGMHYYLCRSPKYTVDVFLDDWRLRHPDDHINTSINQEIKPIRIPLR